MNLFDIIGWTIIAINVFLIVSGNGCISRVDFCDEDVDDCKCDCQYCESREDVDICYGDCQYCDTCYETDE